MHDALTGERNVLQQCEELVTAYEREDWMALDALRKRFRIPRSELKATHREALAWASRITNCNPVAEGPVPARWAAEAWRPVEIAMTTPVLDGNHQLPTRSQR